MEVAFFGLELFVLYFNLEVDIRDFLHDLLWSREEKLHLIALTDNGACGGGGLAISMGRVNCVSSHVLWALKLPEQWATSCRSFTSVLFYKFTVLWLISCPDTAQLTWGERTWYHKSKSLGQLQKRNVITERCYWNNGKARTNISLIPLKVIPQ